MTNGAKNGFSDHSSSVRRRYAREALRTKIKGEECIEGILQCISMAEAAAMMGDKDAVPAINMKFQGHKELLKKVLPDLKAVEVSGADGRPVVTVEYLGRQPYNAPPEIIEGDARPVLDLNTSAVKAIEAAENGPDNDESITDFLR